MGRGLEGYTIVCLADNAYSSTWKSRQQIMSRLAKTNTVIYVQDARPGDRLTRPCDCIPDDSSRLILHTRPRQIPVALGITNSAILKVVFPLTVRLNAFTLSLSVNRFMRRGKLLDRTHTILWLWRPYELPAIRWIPARLICYHCFDEHSQFPFNRKVRRQIRTMEARLCRNADIVFASSRAQFELRKRYNRHTYFMPNGVDFELFSQAALGTLPAPEELSHVNGPIMGCVACFDYRIDVALLEKLLQALPRWTLLLVGPWQRPRGELEHLQSTGRLIAVGEKDRHDVPRYLARMDVALIPFVVDASTNAMYPLKLHEYLAAGKPVVATNLKEVAAFGNLVEIARNAQQFAELVQHAHHVNPTCTVGTSGQMRYELSWLPAWKAVATGLDCQRKETVDTKGMSRRTLRGAPGSPVAEQVPHVSTTQKQAATE